MSEVRITLRMDEALHRALVQSADKAGWSLNREIVSRLAESLWGVDRVELVRTIEQATGARVVRVEPVAREADTTWVIARLSDGRWAAMDDAELAPDRVTVHESRDAALRYQWEGWQDAGGDRGEQVRWLAERPERWVVYYENPETTDDKQAVWLRREGQPEPEPGDGADYLLPGAPIRSDDDAVTWARQELRSEIVGAKMIPWAL